MGQSIVGRACSTLAAAVGPIPLASMAATVMVMPPLVRTMRVAAVAGALRHTCAKRGFAASCYAASSHGRLLTAQAGRTRPVLELPGNATRNRRNSRHSAPHRAQGTKPQDAAPTGVIRPIDAQ